MLILLLYCLEDCSHQEKNKPKKPRSSSSPELCLVSRLQREAHSGTCDLCFMPLDGRDHAGGEDREACRGRPSTHSQAGSYLKERAFMAYLN